MRWHIGLESITKRQKKNTHTFSDWLSNINNNNVANELWVEIKDTEHTHTHMRSIFFTHLHTYAHKYKNDRCPNYWTETKCSFNLVCLFVSCFFSVFFFGCPMWINFCLQTVHIPIYKHRSLRVYKYFQSIWTTTQR